METGKSGWGRTCQKLSNASRACILPGAAESRCSSHVPVRGDGTCATQYVAGEAASTVVRTTVSVGSNGSCADEVGELLGTLGLGT